MARNGHHQRRVERRREPRPYDSAMPHSAEAEESVLGGILVHPPKFADVAQILQPDHFYHPACRAIFDAMDCLDEFGKPIDAVTVLETMRSCETVEALRAFGGDGYLTELMTKVVTVENIGYHARVVRAKATARALVAAAKEIAARGAGDYGDLDEYIAEAERGLRDAVAQRLVIGGPPSVAATLRSDGFRRAQRTYATCFSELNDKIAGGVKARQLTVIAAPTGSGKTGCVSTMALAWARAGSPVLWVCTEIDPEEQAARFAAIAFRQWGDYATPDDFLSLRLSPTAGAQALDALPLYTLYLDDPEGDPIETIRARAAEVAAQHGTPPVIVIDYLQVLAIEDADQRRMSVTKVSTALRKLAKVLDAPVVAISSVSRAYYGKNATKRAEGDEEDPIEWLAAAKDSGDIEFSSAVFIYLDTSKDQDSLGESAARAIVAKSRRGLRGFVGLRFHGPSGLFFPANDSMTTSGRSKADMVDEKVMRFVTGPVYQPMSLRDLRLSVPNARATWVDDAVGRLVAAGRLRVDLREGTDNLGRKGKRRFIVPASDFPTNHRQEESPHDASR